MGITYYRFFMVWSRVGWGIGSRSVVDGSVVDRDREMVWGSMVGGSMKGGMVYRGGMVYSVVHWGSMVGGSMKGSMVNRGGMEGCVVYRGSKDTVVNWGSVEGVGMGMGGNSDIAFGTKGFMGVLVGYAGVMAFVLVG